MNRHSYAVPNATGYDVVGGDLLALRQTGEFAASTDPCLADSIDASSLPYDIDVAPGQAIWFAIRTDAGSYDEDPAHQPASRDPGISAAPASCP